MTDNSMNPPKRPVNIHDAYHAHVYFDHTSLSQAIELTASVKQRFGLALGRVHQTPIGPHPTGSQQIVFSTTMFDTLIPWLDHARGSLSILVHGVTGNDLRDHTDHAYWLGEPVELDLSNWT